MGSEQSHTSTEPVEERTVVALHDEGPFVIETSEDGEDAPPPVDEESLFTGASGSDDESTSLPEPEEAFVNEPSSEEETFPPSDEASLGATPGEDAEADEPAPETTGENLPEPEEQQ